MLPQWCGSLKEKAVDHEMNVKQPDHQKKGCHGFPDECDGCFWREHFDLFKPPTCDKTENP